MKQPALPPCMYKAPHVCKTVQQANETQHGISCYDPQCSLNCSNPAIIVCCFWPWPVDMLWLTVIFCIRTLSYPHSLARLCPLAKHPSLLSHLFSILIYFSFLVFNTIIWCLKSKKSPMLVILPPFFPSGIPQLYLIFSRPCFLCFVIFHFRNTHRWCLSQVPCAICVVFALQSCSIYFLLLFLSPWSSVRSSGIQDLL